MKGYQKHSYIGKIVIVIVILILFTIKTEAQIFQDPKYNFTSFCQFYGGNSFPNVSPTKKGWEKGHCYGFRLGFSYRWLQLTIDFAEHQFDPRSPYWSDIIKEFFTIYTIHYEARYHNEELVYYREWREIADQPDKVSLDSGGQAGYKSIGINLFAKKCFFKNLAMYLGPGFAFYRNDDKDMKFTVWWKDDGIEIHPIAKAPTSETHFGMNIKAGIEISIISFASAQLEIAFHDMFKTKDKYKFFSIQGGLLFPLMSF